MAAARRFCLLPAGERASPRRLFFGGFWAGAAAVGYFVHVFFAPALALGSRGLRARRAGVRRSARFAWLAGFAVGISPYPLGYGLILRKVDGLAGLWAFIRAKQTSLHAFDSSLDLSARVAFASRMIVAVVSDAWHHAMMFGEWVEVPGTPVKLALLVVAPVLLLVAAALRRQASLRSRCSSRC